MEQTTDADVHREDVDTCSVVVKTTTTAPSGDARRNSLIELRRRDAASNQLRGLIIPAASSAQGRGARSSVCLPTISSTKPSSKLLLTQERRPPSGYQSVLARPGLPFTSTSRPTTSDSHRRSSFHGLPVLQQSSALSWSRSLVEPSDLSQRVNNISVNEEDVDSSNHTNELHDPESGRSTASIDAIGEALDEAAGLQSSTLSHSADEGLGDDRLQSPDDNTSSSSASSSSIQLDASRDISMSESLGLPVNDLKTDKQHETQRVSDVLEPMTGSYRPDNSSDLQNSTCDNFIESELISTESQSESVDHTVTSPIISLQIQAKSINNGPVRSHADSVEIPANADAVDADGENSESSLSVDGRLNGHTDDTLTDSNYSVPSRDINNLTDVIINKGNLGLGFCISGGRAASTGDNPIVVKRVFKGETLLQSVLHPGDEIISANDIDMGGMSQHEAWTVLKSLPDGSVRLSVRRRH